MRNRMATMVAGAVAVIAAGCSDDAPVGADPLQMPGELMFEASISDGGDHMASRSDEPIPVNPDDFGAEPFYIYEYGTRKDESTGSSETVAEVQPYWIESGTQGQLNIMPQYKKLNWYAPDTEHRFWSWTWPLGEQDYSEVDISTPPPAMALHFHNSDFPLPEGAYPDDEWPEPTPEQKWNNGEDLERLVGAATGRDYIFNQTGRYVPLTYEHLVSKIILGDFWLIDNTGATQKELKAKITFYGMPKRAMFYPLPANDSEGNAVAPYVIIDPTDPYGKSKTEGDITDESTVKSATEFGYIKNEYLSFYILNAGGEYQQAGKQPEPGTYVRPDLFYICPGVDFGQLQYKVEFMQYDPTTKKYIPHTRYGNRGAYYGDFTSVKFTRVKDDGTEEEASDRILRAGEVMVLNMTVREKSGPGAGVWIRNWNTEKLKSATHHMHPGIYSDAEAAGCRDAFSNNNAAANDGQKDDGYNIYGEDEDINGDGKPEKVIHIYSDINVSNSAAATTTGERLAYFRAYNKSDGTTYIYDGMGYTLNFVNTNTTTNPGPFDTFMIGNVRDLYVTNGVDTIYFDLNGNLCRLDKETGEFVPTGEQWTPNSTHIKFSLD